MRRCHAIEPVLLLGERKPAGFHQLEALVARLILGALGKLSAVFSIVQILLGLLGGHGTYSCCTGRRAHCAAIPRNFDDHFATLMNMCSWGILCSILAGGTTRSRT